MSQPQYSLLLPPEPTLLPAFALNLKALCGVQTQAVIFAGVGVCKVQLQDAARKMALLGGRFASQSEGNPWGIRVRVDADPCSPGGSEHAASEICPEGKFAQRADILRAHLNPIQAQADRIPGELFKQFDHVLANRIGNELKRGLRVEVPHQLCEDICFRLAFRPAFKYLKVHSNSSLRDTRSRFKHWSQLRSSDIQERLMLEPLHEEEIEGCGFHENRFRPAVRNEEAIGIAERVR
ncbi:hypothetical protein C8R43DRAFT_961747 [Mycena crocata]|nr:hypothetical protein C8R43DRAFT_961747 [Mycena crocata]